MNEQHFSWVTPGYACWISASLCASLWRERGKIPEPCTHCDLPRSMLYAVMNELQEKGVPSNPLFDDCLENLEFAILKLKNLKKL